MTDRPRLAALATFLLGAWLTMSVVMTVVATANFVVLKPDRLRDAETVFGALGDVEARKVALRYTASELNRLFFDLYAKGQLALGVLSVLVLVLARRGRVLLVLTGLALLAALLFEFWLVPAIVEQGRVIDFMPREPKPPEVLAFDRTHSISVFVDGGKIVLLALASLWIIVVGRARGTDS